jgi:hypothetical protein
VDALTLNEVSPLSLFFRAVRSSRVVLACAPSAVIVALIGSLVNLAASAFACVSAALKSSRVAVRWASIDPASNVMAAHRLHPWWEDAGVNWWLYGAELAAIVVAGLAAGTLTVLRPARDAGGHLILVPRDRAK